MIADGLVEAERVTEPELAAVSGAGESRGFEGRSRAPAAAGQLSRQQLLRATGLTLGG